MSNCYNIGIYKSVLQFRNRIYRISENKQECFYEKRNNYSYGVF